MHTTGSCFGFLHLYYIFQLVVTLECRFMRGTDCLKQLSFPTRAIRHFRGRKMVYTWAALVVSFAAVVLYCQLPLIVFPALLFVAFLASGGKNFPKVFFRTILRDLM